MTDVQGSTSPRPQSSRSEGDGQETAGQHPAGVGTWSALLRMFGMLATGEAIARLFSFVAVVALARRLGPEGFGLVTLGATLVIWFALVVDSGTEVIGIRDVSRRPELFRQLTEPVLGLRLALSLVAMGAFATFAYVLVKEPSDRGILMLFALTLPAIALNPRWMALGANGSNAVAFGNATAQLLFAGGVLLVVDELHDIRNVPLLQAAAELAYALVVLALIARRWGLLRPRIDLGAWRRTLRASAPLFANSVARAAVYTSSLVLIAVFLTRAEVGYFGAAYRPILFLSTALMLYSHSFLAAYSASRGPRSHELFAKSARLLALGTLPTALLLTPLSPFAVDVVYGREFAAAAGVLAILVWTVPLLAFGGLYASVLIAGDRQADVMYINVAIGLFTLATTAAVLPVAGIEGAAAVTVASHLLVLVFVYRRATALGLAPRLMTLLSGTRGRG